MIESTIEIKGSKKLLELFYESLLPEENFKTDRASYKLIKGNPLKIKIVAEDAVAFRAVSTNLSGLMAIVQKTWKLKNEIR